MAFADASDRHQWHFDRLGGFDQVRLATGADIRHLPELDQKLWAALSCPTTGLEFDARTLQLLDADADGRIRAPEVIAACEWVCRVLKNPDDLLTGAAAVPLAAINPDTDEGARVLASARTILATLGRPDATEITAADTADADAGIAAARFNGDGVVPPAITDDPALAAAITDIIACVGGTPDRGGSDGLDRERCDAFFDAARAYVAWYAEGAADAFHLLPLGDATAAAADTLAAVQAKIDDYFTRTRLAAYDFSATAALNPGEARYGALAAVELSPASAEVAALPLARIEPDRPLPLLVGVNPAWAAPLEAFRQQVLLPLLGPVEVLTEADWRQLRGRFAAHADWRTRMQGAAVHPLGIARVQALLDDGTEAAIHGLIEEDLKLAGAVDAISAVDRLVHYHAHLYRLLNNFVTLRDFYTPGRKAIFQAGTLYLDGRSCELCIEVADIDAHSATAARANTYLAYCDCVRSSGGESRKIVAAFTVGDADQLREGRHGIWYAPDGRDYDATVVKVVEQPISVGAAFWRPYQRFGRMVAEQIEKFGGAREAAVEAAAGERISGGAAAVTTPAAPAAARPAPFDIAKFAGIFAALGLAVGAIGTAFAALLGSLVKLAVWQLPLVVLGVILLISGPSMLMAWMKLRGRNLGPLLDANGWAINTEARLNIPFGASLTDAAHLPPGSGYSLSDPFAEKRTPWGWYLALMLIAGGLGYAGWQGHLGRFWAYLNYVPTAEEAAAPAAVTEEVVEVVVEEEVAPAAEPTPAAAPEPAAEPAPAPAPEPAPAPAAPAPTPTPAAGGN